MKSPAVCLSSKVGEELCCFLSAKSPKLTMDKMDNTEGWEEDKAWRLCCHTARHAEGAAGTRRQCAFFQTLTEGCRCSPSGGHGPLAPTCYLTLPF